MHKNVITISKQLILSPTIVILFLALATFIGVIYAKRSTNLILAKELSDSELSLKNSEKNLSTAQDDISKQQSEINKLEND